MSYGANSGGYKTSQAGLTGPGSSYYTYNAYGYGYSYEGQNGSVYTHAHYSAGGVTTDYRSYSYTGPNSSYASETAYRTFTSAAQASAYGEPAPPYSSAYGYETQAYAHSSLSDTDVGGEVLQSRGFYSYVEFSSGYTVSYADNGSSAFEGGSFVPGSASNYSVETVTNPYGYATETPNLRTY